MSGWERMEGHWWPDIAEHLPKPWPRSAVLMDLRWWDGQERAWEATSGERGRASRPGRPALMARWGWSERRARDLMRDVEAWADPMHGDKRPVEVEPERSSECPANVQPRSRKQAVTTENHSGARPANVQPTSSECPHARSIDPPDPHSTQQATGSRPPGRAPRAPPTKPHPLAVAAWDEVWHEHRNGTAYPWRWKGRDPDGSKVKIWLDVAKVNPDSPTDGIERLRGAMRAYHRAVDAGTAFPHGDPPTTHWFTRDVAKWLLVDPGRQRKTTTKAPRKGLDADRHHELRDLAAELEQEEACLHQLAL